MTGTDRDDYFAISETGVLSFASPPNYEIPADSGRDNVYEVTVVARDDASNSGTLDVVVTVTDVNEGPEISGQQSLSFTENQVYGPGPGHLHRRGTPRTRAAVDNALEPDGGRRRGLHHRRERPADLQERARLRESRRLRAGTTCTTSPCEPPTGRNYGYLEVTVTVQDVNEPPTITTISRASFTYRENGKAALHTFRATDPERSDHHLVGDRHGP